MTMLEIKYFITVVSTGSVSKAAPLLFISRPAISRALNKLEHELGVPLFVRTASGLEPTEMGQLLYKNFIKIQQIIDQTEMQIDNYKEMQKANASGVLRIGLSPVTSVVFFPKFYQAFTMEYPKITLTTMEYDHIRNIAALNDGSLDFLLITDSLITELPEDFKSLDFYESELALAISSEHLLSQKPSVTVDDFKNEPLIYMSTHTDVELLIEKRLKTLGYTPNVIVRTQQLSAVTEFVSKGLGCSVLTKEDIPYSTSRDIVFIPISPPIKRIVRLIWNISLPQKEASHNLVEFSKKYKESLAGSMI